MTQRTFDATVADWLREGPERGPEHGLDRALAAARRVDQRPACAFPGRYLPRPIAGLELRMPGAFTGAAVLLLTLLLLTLLLLLALAISLAGTRPRATYPWLPAAERLIAFQEGPAIFVARLDGSDRRRISGDIPFAHAPLFSPDGTQVAFLAPPGAKDTGGRLVVARVD